jgi:flagellar basal body-associated protein FliL
MAKKKKSTGADDGAKGKKRRKGRLTIVGVVVAVGLLYNFALKPTPAETAEESAALAGVTTTVPEGKVVPVPELVLNLAADGQGDDALHFLRVGVAVILRTGVSAEKFEADAAKVNDAVITVLGDKTLRELQAPGAKEQAKAELTAAVQEAFADPKAPDEPPTVARVIFTSFVMQ